MGLDVYAKGLPSEKSYHCGYITFNRFRVQLAKTFNKKYGEYYKRWFKSAFFGDKLTEQELKEWAKLGNELGEDGLWIFLSHPDNDGKFTPRECKQIYEAIKNLKMDMEGHNYGQDGSYNMLEQWKGMFKHCYKRRVNLYFS